MEDASGLSPLLRHPALWRAREPRGACRQVVASGFESLDACLPGGGWPVPALVEILHDLPGLGELSLLLPALGRLGAGDRLLVLVAPPYAPCLPALEVGGLPAERLLLTQTEDESDALWSAEQALRSAACAAVLLWLRDDGPVARRCGGAARALRRLQLAAETGRSLGVVFRTLDAAVHASPAALRIALYGATSQAPAALELLKSRGGVRRRLDLGRMPGLHPRSVAVPG